MNCGFSYEVALALVNSKSMIFASCEAYLLKLGLFHCMKVLLITYKVIPMLSTVGL